MAINYPQRYDDDFLNTIKQVIDHVNVHGRTIQDLVAEGQLTEEQYAKLIKVVNAPEEVGIKWDGKFEAKYNGLEEEYADDLTSLGAQLAQTVEQIGTEDQRDRQSVWSEFEQRSVNVTWFGAQGDGVTDDTSSIQNAIDTAYINGGGKVFIPKGVYNVTGIKLPSDIHLQGAGKGLTTLFMAFLGGEDTIANKDQTSETGNKNIIITDMTIDSNNTGRSSTSYHAGIRMRYVDNFYIENVYSKNSLGYGFDFWYSYNFMMQYCDASHCWDDGFSIAEETERGLIKFCNSWSNNAPGKGTTNKSGFEVEDGACYITFENCRAWDNEHQNFDIHIHEGEPEPHHITYKDCESFAPVLHHWKCDSSYNIVVDGAICGDTGEARGGFRFINVDNISLNGVKGEASTRIENVSGVNVSNFDLKLGNQQEDKTAFVIGNVENVTITNLIIRDSGVNNFQTLGTVKDLTLSDFVFADAGESGIRLNGEGERISLINGSVKNCGKDTTISSTRRTGIYVSALHNGLSLANINITDEQEVKTQMHGIYCVDGVDDFNLSNIMARNAGVTWDIQYPNNNELVNAVNIIADTIRYNPAQ